MTDPRTSLSWCQKLRWKSYALDRDDVGRAAESMTTGGQTFLCLTTANAVGEDDGLVAPEACTGRRPCYREHATLVMLRRQNGLS